LVNVIDWLPINKASLKAVRNTQVKLLFPVYPSYSWWIVDPGAGLVRLGAALERNL
jgi:hypothetical protein